jgi:hypothetical protein
MEFIPSAKSFSLRVFALTVPPNIMARGSTLRKQVFDDGGSTPCRAGSKHSWRRSR